MMTSGIAAAFFGSAAKVNVERMRSGIMAWRMVREI
jgi:hypothetical protein